MGFVKAHDELMIGDKRSLKRATRFVFLEVCKEARPFGGRLPLPRRGDLADCVHDKLGGNRDEVAVAMSELLDPEDPMLEVATDAQGRRELVIPSWQRWNTNDATGASRIAKFRAKLKEKSDGTNVTTVTTVTQRNVTTGREEKRRSLTPTPSESPPFGVKPEESPKPAEVVDLPLPFALTETLPVPYAKPPKPEKAKREPKTRSTLPGSSEPDEIVDRWLVSQGLPKLAEGGTEIQKFVDHHRARGTKFADWLAGWRNWQRNIAGFSPRAGPRHLPPQPVPSTGSAWKMENEF